MGSLQQAHDVCSVYGAPYAKKGTSVCRSLCGSHTQKRENALYPRHPHPDTNTSYFHHDWTAYSASANISGPLYYINRGSTSDFEYLLSLNISLNGSIGLLRAGGASRIVRAHQYGLLGIIVWNDVYPNQTQVYPYGPYVPKSGFQLGSVKASPCPGNLSPETLKAQCGLDTDEEWEDVFPSQKVRHRACVLFARALCGGCRLRVRTKRGVVPWCSETRGQIAG